MRKWEAIAGSAIWMMIALSMTFAALQPVELSASAGDTLRLVQLCPDGGTALAMGCESIHL
jgi:hypothetical protein